MTIVRITSDAWVSSASPSLTTGKNPRFRLQDGSPTKRAFMFGHLGIPQGAVVQSSRLRIRGRGTDGTSATLTLQRVNGPWAETGINYNNQPDVFGPTVDVSGTQSTDGQPWDFPIASLVQTMVDNNRPFNVRIVSDSATEIQFYSRDSDVFAPELEVEYAMPPAAPTELSPAGGAKVTLAKPKLRLNYSDVTGDDEMLALQVQVNATNTYVDEDTGFDSPDFDTATAYPDGYPTPDPELDLADSTLSFADIVVDTSKWWACRVQSAAGVWSNWSRPVNFGRVARGTLAILSPSGGVVNDATQEIIWSLTGATQIAWLVEVFNDATGERLHRMHSGRGNATDTSYTLPKGVITSESITYRIRVRVWESLTRVTTPGDPVFTEAVETFVFAEDPTPDPFTNASARQLSPGNPVVVVHVERGAAPDLVSVWRDGELVATDIDPADLAVSPGVYEFHDYTAPPRLTHTYKVRPKVDGKLGPAVTATIATTVPDVWLADPHNALLVPLKSAQVQFAAPQPGSSHMVKNGKYVQRVYQTQQGMQGTVRGLIIDSFGSSAAQWVENFDSMRDREKDKFRLIVGNLNQTVVLSDVVPEPYPSGGPSDTTVSFGFWSQSPDWT
jgi:hypothetical protein